MKFVMEIIGDSIIEVVGFIAFIGVFIAAFATDGFIVDLLFQMIAKAS